MLDGSLAPEHLADLRKSGLTSETIAQQLIRSDPAADDSAPPGSRPPPCRPSRTPSGRTWRPPTATQRERGFLRNKTPDAPQKRRAGLRQAAQRPPGATNRQRTWHP